MQKMVDTIHPPIYPFILALHSGLPYLVRSTDITIYHDMVMVPDLRVRSANFAGGIGLVKFDDDKFDLVMPNGRAYRYLFRRN